MQKQMLKNLFSNYAGNLVAMGLGFLLIPFLIKHLGREGFGVTVLAESLIMFLQIFIFAVRMALSRYSTVSVSHKQTEELAGYLIAGRRILMLFMWAVLAAGLVLSFFFPVLFNVPSIYFEQSRWLFLFIVTAFVISIPNAVYWAVLYAHQRYDLINVSNFGGGILRVAGILILFSALPLEYANLVTYGIVYFCMTLMQNFLIFIWAKKIAPNLNLEGRSFSRIKAKQILSYGGYSSLASLSPVLYENTMNILINIFLGPGANAVFAIGSKFPVVLKRLLLEPSWALVPSFTDLAARGERERLQGLFSVYSKTISLVLLVVGGILIILSRHIIRLWVGNGFEQASSIMNVLLIVMLVSMFTYFSSPIVSAYGVLKIPTLVGLGLVLLNIALGAFLAFHLKMGIMGIAYSALFISVISSLFSSVYACHVMGISVVKYWAEALIKPVALSSVVFSGVAFSSPFLSILGLIGLFFAAGLVFVIGAYLFVYTQDERAGIRDVISDYPIKFFMSDLIFVRWWAKR